MKILVCLISRQHIPNLMSIHAIKFGANDLKGQRTNNE